MVPARVTSPSDSADPADPTDLPGADPFGTGELVAAVLATWTTSPARFREDANAEESLTLGYADRALIELAANAVDAARDAGIPARIRVSTGRSPSGRPELRVANTGSPLTAEGVQALASLRASAKRDQPTVGHFGVGFTSVLGLTDAPRVISTTGGVEFSVERTIETVTAQKLPELTKELRARQGAVPALRLCWPADDPDPVPEGYATEVRLPIVPSGSEPEHITAADPAATAVDRLMQQWRDAVIDHVMWALPDLQQVELPDRTIDRRWPAAGRDVLVRGSSRDDSDVLDDNTAAESRVELVITERPEGELSTSATTTVLGYSQVGRSGRLPADLLAQLPIEQRDRADWWIRWVFPDAGFTAGSGGAGDTDRAGVPAVNTVCAPTPTDERLTLPARLIGSFVVDDTRRHLSNGPITDFLLGKAVEGYLELVAAVLPERRPELVPPTAFPAGDHDARLREDILRRWRTTPLLQTALGDQVSPAAAVTIRGLDPDTTAALAEAIPGLLPPADPVADAALRTLGVTELPIGAAVEALTALVRGPEFWHQIYSGLAGFDVDSLAGLPVPLVDGRQVIGARGLLLPESGTAALAARAATVLPGLRLVHPQAVHPLLERLGAAPADADAMLTSPVLIDEIAGFAADLEDGSIDPEDLAADGSRWVGAREPTGGARPDDAAGPAALAALVLDLLAAGGRGDPAVLADLILTADDGEPWPAGGLLLPGSPLRPLVSDDDLPTAHRQWTDLWTVEVLAAVGVRQSIQVIPAADPRAGDLLPDLDEWLDQVADSGTRSDPNSWEITDLDLIDDADWPAFLALASQDRRARSALLADGYTAWWLREHVRFGGDRPGAFRLPDAADLVGLFEPLPVPDLDQQVQAAIGVLPDLETALDSTPQQVLDRFCDAAVHLPAAAVPALSARLVTAMSDGLELPASMRTLSGQVADAADVAVPDGPWWAQVRGPDQLVAPGADPGVTADAFALEPASERWGGAVVAADHDAEVPAVNDATRTAVDRWQEQVLDALSIDPDRVPKLVLTRGLAVRLDGEDRPIPVGWWPRGDGFLVDGSVPAVADALAWSTGRWADRELARAAAFGTLGRVVTEAAFEQSGAGPPRRAPG